MMLISFTVSNFQSFAAGQTIHLIASARLDSAHEDHALPIPDSDERVLRAGLIYGANGAGKSNLLNAVRYVRHITLNPSKEACGTGRNSFRLADFRDQPSAFDLQFIAADKRYRCSLCLDDERIIEERLFYVVGSKQQLIYERHTDGYGRVEIDAPGLKNESDKLLALVKVGSRHNQSFLATARATLEPGDIGKTLAEVIDWLHNGLTLIGPRPTPNLAIERLVTDTEFRQFAGDFLKATSIAIDHLKVDKRELSEESDGTQRLLDLLPALYRRIPGNAVYFVDEIDRSMHPLLVYKLLECFLRGRTDCQLIVTTHEPHLLDLDLLRRDEVWFAEKDSSGATNLCALADFKVRKDLRVQRAYLEGRFGAVPRVGEIERLMCGRGQP
jgi:AAA15 family ATPase/GTPase